LNPTFQHRGRRAPFAALSALSLLLGLAHAQTAPDAGSLLRQIEQQRPAAPLVPPPPRVAPPPPLKSTGQTTVQVKSFGFTGNTLLTAAQLAPAVASYLNRPLSFAELQNAAMAVAAAYRQAGWVVRAYLPQQDITGGAVTIHVVEAVFGTVHIEGQPRRVGEAQLRRVIEAAQAPGATLNGDALDRALLLIDDLPGISATGRLAEGQQQAETDLMLAVTDGPLFSGDLTADNTGSRSTGATRMTANLSVNSPTGRADQAQAMLMHTSGSNYLRGAYSLPVGAQGWRVGANFSHMSYKLRTPEFAQLDAHGTSTTTGLDFSYPWLRSRTKNVYLSLGLDHKRFDNQSAGVTATHYKTAAATLGVSGNLFDDHGGGGSISASASLVQGRVDLAGSPNEAADAASTRSAGSFGKLRFSVSRQQVLSPAISLFVSMNGQLASKNLDSSEKFYLGGSGGVRAYPGSEGGGSEGQIVAVELRTRVAETVNVTAFMDHGSVRVNKNNDITGAALQNHITLKGVGVSVGWTAPLGIGLKATVARRLGSNPNPTASGNDQDGSLKKTRLWLQASLPF
jgi:hemolysin activation/secretion protein